MVLGTTRDRKLRCRSGRGPGEQLIEQLESTYGNDLKGFCSKPLTSLDEGLYALACEEDVRCLATLVRSFKLIEVYIEHGVDTQSHVLPILQSQFSDINLSFVSQQATASQVINDVIRQLSFDETELDGEAGFADVAGSGVDNSGLSHDESFGVDDLDLNLNEEPDVNLNVSQVETQSELSVSEEPDVGHTQEPILAEVGTQEPIVAEVLGKLLNRSSDRLQVQMMMMNVDEYFLVDEENEIVEPDVDVHLFGISMDLPFDNIGITNLVSDDVLEGEDVDVINVMVSIVTWAKKSVYLHSIESRRNLKLYKNDGVRIRARCDGKVTEFTMSQGTNDDNQASSSILDARDKGDLYPWVLEIKHCTYKFLSKKIFEQVRVNPDIPVKAVQDQLQRELEVQISMSKAFRAKA
ncbi:hypothetical protein Tco_0624148 [Tanacetum coccineum]|uniref:Uncharacterized protein n=1 Tax=Tanacetum coccineum TaxID=301880 RepID=A0ABQ4WD53_9ASTR